MVRVNRLELLIAEVTIVGDVDVIDVGEYFLLGGVGRGEAAELREGGGLMTVPESQRERPGRRNSSRKHLKY